MTLDPDSQLSVLFTQLTWPSGLVRERACVAIAELLRHLALGQRTQQYLLRWLGAQHLESVAALGLLPLIRAHEDEPAFALPPPETLATALGRRSLLSWQLLQELFDDPGIPLEDFHAHSADAPADFEPLPFFEEYIEAFLPPVYHLRAKGVERSFRIPFRRHWAFEWTNIVAETGTEISMHPLRFWLGGRDGDERYGAPDMMMSEVYRSAYLRALSWASARGSLPERDAKRLAAQTSPIDLTLWKLLPGRRPSWWPRSADPAGKIDTVPGYIWQQVEALWEKHRSGEPWLGGTKGGGQALAAASGVVHVGLATYELRIFGVFQKCFGPHSPSPEDPAEWVTEGGHWSLRDAVGYTSPLRFEGMLLPQDIREFAEEFADWSLVPAAVPVMPLGAPRWQFWRMFRNIWLPAPWIRKATLTFGYSDDAITIRDGEEVVGTWCDWTDGLSEHLVDEVPPSSGQFLLVPRHVIDSLTEATESTYCWICSLTTYSREQPYEAYQSFTDSRVFGATRIVT